MPTPPTLSSFPPHLTLTITPPSPQTHTPSSQNPSPNILLLLHSTGDTSHNLTPLARALNLPETTTITLQAPTPLPFDLGGFHWGDDITFTPDGNLDMDAGFTRSVRVILQEVIMGVLVGKCGYRVRDVLVWGLGQGGMVGLEVARALEVGLYGVDGVDGVDGERCLGGVVSIGAPVGLEGGKGLGGGGRSGNGKSKTPVLIAAGKEGDGTVVTAAGVKRTQEWFEFVEVVRYKRRGDGMPKNREEMTPIMAFLARRLRSYKGVPEGSVEIS
ncbi:alpha/beta hydrolase [Aspergillus ibericus CBS 121593]|uniref:Phospholipase/carboxylesterase/thioesterase domain-containing protein n=1 Tax=Aspergillus ibericus CBS 121593 TaxID=1448316 RepID=A0A395GTY9_9EURO|nr:hypothetical protein BO80DRAFT_149509 [Aspergillus ibericus CBS 121593]RAK98916.1 hypothetical protein BO80DRAFT_149509 [Aspergillus ibericus CBS 121593]